jgi:hypothetical protein
MCRTPTAGACLCKRIIPRRGVAANDLNTQTLKRREDMHMAWAQSNDSLKVMGEAFSDIERMMADLADITKEIMPELKQPPIEK